MEALTIEEFIAGLEYAFLAGKREKDFNEWFKKAYGRAKNFKVPNNAINFTEWLNNNNWTFHLFDYKTETTFWRYRKLITDEYQIKTTQELYAIFIEEQLKRK